MASIDLNTMKTWNDRDIMTAAQYDAERNKIITAVNDTDARVSTQQGQIAALTGVSASQPSSPNTLVMRDPNGNVQNGQNQNLLFNPTACLGLSGWSAVGALTTWSSVFGLNGMFFQSPNVNNTGSYTILQSQRVPSTPGQIVTLSGDIDTTLLTVGQVWIEVDCFDASNNAINVQSGFPLISPNQKWTRESVSFTIPTSTSYTVVRLVLSANAVGTACFRKIKLETGAYATTFSDDNTLNTSQYGSALGLIQTLSGSYKTQISTSPISAVVATAGVPITVSYTFTVPFSVAPVVDGIAITSTSVGDVGYINIRATSVTTTSVTFTVNSYVAQTINFNFHASGS